MTQSTITITGTEQSQYVVNTSTISPFSNVVIADSAPGQIETVTVSLEAPGGGAAPGNGALSNLGAGTYDAFTGTYTVTGTAAEVTAALNNLVFMPTVADQPEHSVFAINVVDSAGDTALSRTTTVVSAHPITIATNGVTTLASVANGFIVENLTGTALSFLKVNGSVVTTSTFAAGWTAVGAVRTGSGYEVAFWNNDVGGTNQYVVWNVDSNGNYISNATGVLSGTGAATELAALEAAFGEGGANAQFFGQVPATPSTIVDNGTTTLALVGNLFELNPDSGGTGPLLELNGSVVIQGQQLGSWTPVGAVQTGDGYEVAFSMPGQNQYTVWNVGANGNYTSRATGVLSSTNPTQALELGGIEAAFGENFAGVPAAAASAIGTNGDLAELEVGGVSQTGDAYKLGGTGGTLLELNGSVVTNGQFGAAGWTPVGALQTGNGYEVAFKSAAGTFVVWNTDSNGDYTSNATGVLAATSLQLADVEAAFGDGKFAGSGVDPATATPIATNGKTTLAELEVSGSKTGDAYELNPAGGSGGPLLELHGGAVTKGQFGAAGWTPVGAVQTATGYEVAFESSQHQFVIWNTDLNGDYVSNATGVLSGTSYALEQLETTFGEDLNGDGTTGPKSTQIGGNGALDAVANQFQLNPGGNGPFLTLNGSVVTQGQFGAANWAPVGALQTGNGWEVAFGNGANQYVVWNVDSNGAFTGNATPVLPGNSLELQGVEAAFNDGTFTGGASLPATATQIATNGTTALAELEVSGSKTGDAYELNPAGEAEGPLLELNGIVVTKGQFGAAGWTPVGAVQTAAGYEVAFGNGANQYVVWNTDSAGNYVSNATAVLAGNSLELRGVEAAFGDGTFAGGASAPATAKTIASNTTTTLAELEVSGQSQNGDAYELNPLGGSGGPLLELHGSAVTNGQFGAAGWTPVGALQTGNGYEVAFWNNDANGQNQYVVWNTDSNGDYTSNATGVLAGNSLELQGVEAAFGDGTFAGASGPAAASQIGTPTPNGQLAELEVGGISQHGDAYELGGTGGPLLELGGNVVTAGSLGGGAWTPVGAQRTSTGYEVVWNNLFVPDEYTVWNTDAGGNYTSSALGLVSGQNFMLEDLNPVWGENVSGALSLSTYLATTANQANTDSQQGNTTINIGNNTAFANDKGGLGGSSLTFSGTTVDLTLGSHADIIEYTLTPASGIEEITGFGANDELNINLRGLTPPTALQIVNNGASSVSIFSSADPAHGIVLLGLQTTDLATPSIVGGAIGQGHALITLKA
jgi:hypothetical protein